MLLVNTKVLKESNNLLRSQREVHTSDSIFSFTLETMTESNKIIRLSLQEIYTTNSGYMNEGFVKEFIDKFDFKEFVGKIISLFIKGIEKIFKQFKSIIAKYFSNPDSTIKKYEQKIKDATFDLDEDIEHFRYTLLDKDIPSPSLKSIFIEEYDSLLDKLKKLSSGESKPSIISKLGALNDEVSHNTFLSDENLIRKRVLGLSDYEDPVTSEMYIPRLYSTFRNGILDPIKTPIAPVEYKEALSRYNNRKTLISSIEKSKNDIIKSSSDIQKKIEKITPKDIMEKYVPIDYDVEFALDRVLKTECGLLQKYCDIVTTAFGMKLEAAKEALIQDKKVLLYVIGEIIKREG